VQDLYQPQSYPGYPSPVPGLMPDTDGNPASATSIPLQGYVQQPLSGTSGPGLNPNDPSMLRARQRLGMMTVTAAKPVAKTLHPQHAVRSPIPLANPNTGSTIEPTTEDEPASPGSLTTIAFAPGSKQLTPALERKLRQIAVIYGSSGAPIVVQGGPASTAPAALATARAQASTVARYLISYGIPTSAIKIVTGTPSADGKGNLVAVKLASASNAGAAQIANY
jgi:outer membrane protein OmpA-like peptidoglycan-associated protein